MSVDCNAYLPVRTSEHDIADALAILLGAKAAIEPLGAGSSDGAIVCNVKGVGVRVRPSGGMFAWADLDIAAPLQEHAYTVGIAAEAVEPNAYKSVGLAPSLALDTEGRASLRVHFGSGPVRVAIAMRLAEFFGGMVEPQDSGGGKYEGKRVTFKRAAPSAADRNWNAYQRALASLRPLSVADIRRWRKYAYWEREE